VPILYEVSHVEKTYKKGKVRANRDISFTVQQGEILGVFGPNGAGKSTLIKQLVGHIKPTSGEIRFEGKDIFKQTNRLARLVSYYAQEPHALTSLKVREVITFTGRLRGMPKRAAEREADILLEQLHLTDVQHKLLKRISGGQKRLVGIAAALIGDMKALILDEPTNELDPENRRLVWNLILEYNRTRGVTVLLVTHNVLEAEQVVDRVMVIDRGQLLAIDTVGRLKQLVDQRLRIEVTSRFGEREKTENALKKWGEVIVLSENRLRLMVDKHRASAIVSEIIEQSDAIACEEYKLIPPSLEDVYFHLGGKEALTHGN